MTAYGGCAREAFEPAWLGKCPGLPPCVQPPPLPCTTNRSFGRCDAGHEALFTVNPNIPAADALVHIALYLRCAYETGYKTLDYLREEGRGMYWSNLHAIEMAEGLVEAILDGIESAPSVNLSAENKMP